MTERVPAIGAARGVFEIFIPGLFLLLNLWATLYLFPFTDEITRNYMQSLTSSPVLSIVVGITFGYLAGVILRLFRADLPDRHSGYILRLLRKCRIWKKHNHKEKENQEKEQLYWLYETFPYPNWLRYLINNRFPEKPKLFLSQFWLFYPEKIEKYEERKHKQFINFCKVVVSSADPGAAIEIYSAESLSRYISGMYYAILLSLIMLVITLLSCIYTNEPFCFGLITLVVCYVIGIIAILSNFRFIRIREVETIFAAVYKNRELFI